ncbi:hypothetical protein HGRIS_014951 [Hohenbuehelia grisea]|uniref:C3H1-type domain-containing protein n=1 Tax=Hohenbuehelia grisea TaxID=104357 RepID=A0ABR3J1Y2_9AGAR
MIGENFGDNLPFWTPPSSNENQMLRLLDNLRHDVHATLLKDAKQSEAIKRLEQELAVHKRAIGSYESEHKSLLLERDNVQRRLTDTETQKTHLESQLKGHRVVALLDGDGVIFAADLIRRGQSGGHDAARKLSDSIMKHLTDNYGPNPYQLYVYIFVNKRGLTETFGKTGHDALKAKFEDFIIGFNQAAERFMVVDVGPGKEAADAKIKAYLEDEIRLPHSCKVIFGGCHDNGYVTSLRSLITAGYKQKLILLQSYTGMAAGINGLDLPVMTCEDLFMSQKLGSQPYISPPPPPAPAPATVVKILRNDGRASRTASPEPDTESFLSLVAAPAPVPDHTSPPRPSAPPPTYSTALQAARRASIPIPELDSCDSSSSSDTSETPCPSSLNFGTRHLNPKLPLSKQKPPPCTLFYLSDCKFGAECKYGHEYILDETHIEEIRANAKKAPCPAINKGEVCTWGDKCCYGHVCNMAPKCTFYRQGRCKFIGADMHKESKGLAA